MTTDPPGETVIRGVPAAPGQALGAVLVYRRPPPAPPPQALTLAQVPGEQARVVPALAAAQAELEQLAADLEAVVGPEQAAIFTAQAMMAADPTLAERAAELVAADQLPADAALLAAAAEQADLLAALDDAYLRERAADIRDVGARAARLARGEAPALDLARLPRPAIILADDLAPSETAGLDRARVLGIGLAGGGPTSHVAVLARALGLPLVCGLGTGAVEAGAPAFLDGDAGLLVLQPSPARRAAYAAWQAAQVVVQQRQ